MSPRKIKQGLTKIGVARKLGLHHSAISHAIKAGRIELNEDGRIDPENETNQKYFRKHKTAIKAQGKGGVGKPIITEDPDELVGNSVEQNRSLDVQLKKVKLKKARIEYLEAVKKLIPIDMVSRNMSNIFAQINENFQSFDERHRAELYEVAHEKSETEFGRYLYKLIYKAIENVMKGVQKELDKLEPLKEPEPVKELKMTIKKPEKVKPLKKKTKKN